MAEKRLTVVNKQTGEVETEVEFSGGYNILYTRHEDNGQINKILKLNNARFGVKHWIMNEWYAPIGRRIMEKFEKLEWLKQYKILYLEDKEWEPTTAVWNWKARIKKTNAQFYEGTGYDFIIETRKYYTEQMTREQLVLLIYHELRHIGEDGKLKHHNIEEWNEIVATVGNDWSKKGQEVIDILSEDFGEEDWMAVLPTRRQMTLFK